MITIIKNNKNEIIKIIIFAIVIGVLSTVFHIFKFANIPWYVQYSDIVPFYEEAIAGLPYIESQIEYPPLTGILIYICGRIGHSLNGYYLATGIFLTLCFAFTTIILYKMLKEYKLATNKLLIFWIFAPTTFIFLIYNWDIIAIMFTVLGLYYATKDKYMLSSLFFALGFCTKFYPIIYLLPLFLKKVELKRWIKIGAIFAAIVLAINLPFMLMNFNGWLHFFSFNSVREQNIDSIWQVIKGIFPSLNVATINLVSAILFGASALFAAFKMRKESIIKVSFIITLLFLLFNKVFSPQYVLWLLPFFVLIGWNDKTSYYSMDISNILVMLFTLMIFFNSTPETLANKWFMMLSNVFVVVRHVILVYIVVRIFFIKNDSIA